MTESVRLKNTYWIIGLCALLLFVVAAWVMNNQTETKPFEQSQLARVINECDLISSKAALALPEQLPFQRLEKSARQSNVLQQCMHDRGYIENPVWSKYASPIATKNAKNQQISQNEAYENLKRIKMLVFIVAKDEPLYWILQP